ncbi:MAG: N-acetylneuraminate synthase family protein [bacterium]|nr:N-acetylneuraminate synthase family protein [bacterium]
MKKNSLAKLGIGRDKKIFIIAEAGINHGGSLKTAKRMIDAAHKAGASAIKFQTYVTEKRVKAGSPIFDILKKCELSPEDTKELKKYADSVGIIFFSTPFDVDSVFLLKKLGVQLMKIASFDLVNKQLLKAVASTKIPIVISRGMSNKKEIDEALAICKKAGVEFALLHCVSAYPTPKNEVNLKAVHTLLESYDCPVGYSDHTLDITACLHAVAMGGTVLEKHFTLDKNMEGPDHKLSADPRELAALVAGVRDVEKMLGGGKIESLGVEKGTRMYRRPSK